MARTPVQTLSKQDRASIKQAAKLCFNMAAQQMDGFIAACPAGALYDGRYAGSDFTLPDGTRVTVSLHLSVWKPRDPDAPLMIEGPK